MPCVVPYCRQHGGVLPFNPASIATLQVRLDFDDWSNMYTDAGVTKVTALAQTLYRVTNKGALGGYFEQSSAAARPTVAEFSTGKNGVTGDGGDHMASSLAASAFKFLSDGSRFVVMAHWLIDSTPNNQFLLETGGSSSLTIGQLLAATSEANNKQLTAQQCNAGGGVSFAIEANSSNNVYTVGTPFVATWRSEYNITGNDFIIRANGTQVYGGNYSNAPSASDPSQTMRLFALLAGTLPMNARCRRLWIWQLPAAYPDDFIPLAEAAIVL
jgi:hypothetical protein